MKYRISIYIIFFVFSAMLSGQRLIVPENPTSLSNKAGAFINVNSAGYAASNYTIEQLIKDVLITGGNGNCATPNISNVTVSPNLSASNSNRSWGYFNKGTTAFPFNEGIVLSTGYANKTGNSYYGQLSDALGTGGDIDLANAIGVSNNMLFDATYIEFDFVPQVTTLKFNYIFASEEYTQSFPCTYTDGFALLIKKQGMPNYTNLAVLPGGAGPVSVTNIHPAIGTVCGAVNPQYFAGYNTSNIETNFNGRTVPLTATTTVIPGQTYHFKIVLADYSDTTYDSGVFLQAGSFNIGVQIGDGTGATLPGNISVCSPVSQNLVASSQAPGSTFQWFLNGVAIAGATNNTYTATQAGTYSVEVTVPGSNCPGTAQVVIATLPSPVVQNANMSVCSTTATGIFNLTSSQPNISTTPGVTFSYYQNQADALAGNGNTIATPTAYSSTNGIVFVRVLLGNCAKVAQLQLTVNPIPATPVITSTANTICAGGSVTLTSNYTTGNTWSTGATTQSITINTPGTYSVTNANANCTSTAANITINADTNPNVQISGNLAFCQGGSSILTATSTGSGNTYSWSNGSTTASTTVSTAGNYTVTVTTPAGCTYTKSVTVTVDTPPVAQNANLSECSTSNTATFNLTNAQTSISTTPGATFTFYQNQADAQAGNTNNIATPNSYVSGNTTLYVLVKKGTCSQIVQLQLNVTTNSTPTITASSTKICGTGSVTLTSNFAIGNTWSTGATTQSITVTSTGTYTVTNTIGTCTGSPASITITGDPDPIISISGNSTYCSTPITLTASATGNISSYSWSNGTTGATTTVNNAGTYTVTGTTPSGCQFTKTFTVNAGVVPTVQNASLSMCSAGNTSVFNLTTAQNSISTTPNITFSYYQNLADAQAGNANTIATPNAYTSGNATIFVLVKTATCSSIAQLQLIVTTIPVTTITQSAPAICANTPVVLTSNYATGNSWSNGSTNQSITVTTPGTYTVTTTNGNCVGNTASVTLVSTPDPNLQITGNLNFCQGSSTNLSATANGNANIFTWSNGTNGANTLITAPGTYTATVTTPSGCQFQKTVTVTMDPQIVINIATPAQIDCNNSQVTLNASNSVFVTGSTILWTTSGGGNIISGANTLTPIVNNAGTYILTITSPNANGCSSQASVTVIKNITPPTIAVNASSIKICKGQSVILTATGAATYTWTGLTGNGNIQSVTPTSTTTYTVTGVGANGCIATTPASVTITVVPEIVSTLQNGNMCKGDALTLDAGAGPNYTYTWNTGQTTQTISVTNEGTYSVIINNGTCTKTVSAIVTYTKVPTITEIIYDNHTLTVTATNPQGGIMEYSIDNGANWQTSNVFTNIDSNKYYTVYVRNKGINCYNSVQYFTVEIRNAITPNGDGENDTINFGELAKYDDFGGNIYDRYGKSVFKLNKTNYIWNGQYINAPLPTATYWYQLHWKDPISLKLIEKTGWILLKNRD